MPYDDLLIDALRSLGADGFRRWFFSGGLFLVSLEAVLGWFVLSGDWEMGDYLIWTVIVGVVVFFAGNILVASGLLGKSWPVVRRKGRAGSLVAVGAWLFGFAAGYALLARLFVGAF